MLKIWQKRYEAGLCVGIRFETIAMAVLAALWKKDACCARVEQGDAFVTFVSKKDDPMATLIAQIEEALTTLPKADHVEVTIRHD